MHCDTIKLIEEYPRGNPFYEEGKNYKNFCDGAEELGYTIDELKLLFRIEPDDIEQGTLILPEWKGLPIIKTDGQKHNVECICGVNIKDQFIISNKKDGVAMVIGSTCITKFLPGHMAEKIPNMIKEAKKKKEIKKLEKDIKALNDWNINEIIQDYKLVGKKKDYIKEIDLDWKDIIDCCDMCPKSYKNENSYNYLLNNNNDDNDIIICCTNCLNKLEKKGLKKYIPPPPPPPPPKPCITCKKFYPSVKDSIDNECKLCSTKPLCKGGCGKRYLKAKIQNRYGICKNCYWKPCINSGCNNTIRQYTPYKIGWGCWDVKKCKYVPYTGHCYQCFEIWKEEEYNKKF